MHIPGALTEAEAARYLSAAQHLEIARHCHLHQVTTCPTCNGLWQLNQLLLVYSGYFPQIQPTDPAPTDPTHQTPTDALNPTGARYSLRCPYCRDDLTDLVILHWDACRLTAK